MQTLLLFWRENRCFLFGCRPPQVIKHRPRWIAAELSAAAVVLLASPTGIPVSSTHILIGVVLGIRLVNGQVNWGLMKPIALAWVITLT